MQLILKEDVHNLGKSGELVTVKDGYGRNYLLPQGKAVAATRKNVAQLDHERKLIAARNLKLAKDAQSIADRLAATEITLHRQAGEGDKLFGSVTARDIEEALTEKGLKLDRRKIALPDPIRSLGVYTLDIKLTSEVTGKIKVWVVAKD
ncbi:MAG: 50S ribosomal protein L9 [Myxococcales bacterium]|nr:50S ribosomal protein L9 [Myxococcales bacterium]